MIRSNNMPHFGKPERMASRGRQPGGVTSLWGKPAIAQAITGGLTAAARQSAAKPESYPKRTSTARGGFTLVELLVVMTVLAILSGMVMFAMFGAQERARVARTQATINKLNAIIMPMYESYQTRRVPVVTAGMGARQGAYLRLQALRELMKIEMPDRFTDITKDPQILPRRTSLANEFRRRLNQSGSGDGVNRESTHQSAECLYLIVTMSTSDSAGRENFSDREVGDKDEDGYREFLDGWGRPISFIRWPAGFNSPLQPFRKDSNFREGDDWAQGQVYHDWKNSHDPFDTRNVEDPQDDPIYRTYAIYPLIYSPGGDGVSDIASKGTDDGGSNVDPYPVISGDFGKRIDPYMLKSTNGPIGRQRDSNDDGDDWHDNIHNHHNRAELR